MLEPSSCCKDIEQIHAPFAHRLWWHSDSSRARYSSRTAT